MAAGTLLAAREALDKGVGFNIGGGFHHAFAGYGEGFCAINDVAVAIRVLQQERRIRTALVVDCDVHHGNGTAAIFAGDKSVFTLSIHHFNNYPTEKPPSTLDIHLLGWGGLPDDLNQPAASRMRRPWPVSGRIWWCMWPERIRSMTTNWAVFR